MSATVACGRVRQSPSALSFFADYPDASYGGQATLGYTADVKGGEDFPVSITFEASHWFDRKASEPTLSPIRGGRISLGATEAQALAVAILLVTSDSGDEWASEKLSFDLTGPNFHFVAAQLPRRYLSAISEALGGTEGHGQSLTGSAMATREPPLGENLGRMWDRVLKVADQGDGIFGTWGPEPVKPPSGPTPERQFKRRFTPYVLRHTMITQNYLQGMPLELLSRRAGHTQPMFTFRRYGKGVQARHTTAAAANFDQVMAKVRRAALKVS